MRLITGILVLLGLCLADITACISTQSYQTFIYNSYEDSYNKPLSENELLNISQQITVKIITEEAGGSGIIVKKINDNYFILTNNHVLQNGGKHKIQTQDGKIYNAKALTIINFNKNDLALLQFSSKINYKVATLGKSTNIEVGDRVFAVGFPFQEDNSKPEKFKFTIGKVSMVNEKILDGGYQIGYTNEIEKGMSGGAVLNSNGEVIAVNGMHAYPIWGDPYVYVDNTKPCKPMHDLMVESSWAIPIETFKGLAPNFYDISKDKPSLKLDGKSNSEETSYQVLVMRSRADSAKRCTVFKIK